MYAHLAWPSVLYKYFECLFEVEISTVLIRYKLIKRTVLLKMFIVTLYFLHNNTQAGI